MIETGRFVSRPWPRAIRRHSQPLCYRENLPYTSPHGEVKAEIPNQVHRQQVGFRRPRERWGCKALEVLAHADMVADAAGADRPVVADQLAAPVSEDRWLFQEAGAPTTGCC